MKNRSKDLSLRLKSFNDAVISFVEKLTEEDWRKVCSWEQWSVGVTARHIGAGHYRALAMVKMILNGEKFPDMTMDDINESANVHAKEHAECTKPEVLDILRDQGKKMVDLVGSLDDSQLDKAAHMPAMGREITVEQLIQNVVILSAGEHFENMKAAAKG